MQKIEHLNERTNMKNGVLVKSIAAACAILPIGYMAYAACCVGVTNTMTTSNPCLTYEYFGEAAVANVFCVNGNDRVCVYDDQPTDVTQRITPCGETEYSEQTVWMQLVQCTGNCGGG